MTSDLFEKYDVPVPRYTSYPTVPQWHATPTRESWIDSLGRAGRSSDAALSVYVHIPFCESLCSFCGCNTVITRDHNRESTYVDAILAELNTYLAAVPELRRQPFGQMHLGGGTPTFLSPASLARLIDGIAEVLPCDAGRFAGSVEVDPRVTNVDQLETLRKRGFRRISLGVQDVDPNVQRLVNRVQPVEQTRALTLSARELGYDSINIDLIYGLPGQTPETIATLAAAVLDLAPDRLAVYSFARVPWIKPAQRRFRDDQIPSGAEKRALYEAMRAPLIAAGYVEIGLDHFARPHDALAEAAESGRLHRNFMGYTEVKTTTLLGLGVSAISETPDCYHQNEKVITAYERRVSAGEIPTLRGHELSGEDRSRRELIADLMTVFAVELSACDVSPRTAVLESLVADGLVEVQGTKLIVRAEGRAFLRNAATIFDAYFTGESLARPTYSSSV